MTDDVQLIYVHDPMCSWCWGFRPVFEQLCNGLDGRVQIRRLLGGLAADSDATMPEAMQAHLQETWRRIQQRIPGTPFNFDFWHSCRPQRSTWPACRAVLAARRLDPAGETPMIAAIQRAYYLEARNPSESDTLVALADETGLDAEAFAALLGDVQTQAMLAGEIAAARRLGADSFPSLRLQIGTAVWPITLDYNDPAPMRETVDRLAAG